jgi:hypothetical protein
MKLVGPVPLTPNAASVKISPNQVSVPAGQSAVVTVEIQPPTGLDAKTFPVFSGFIKASGDDNSSLHSTYLGAAAPLKDMKILDNTDFYFGVKLPLVIDKDGNPINGSTTYTMTGTDTPFVVYRLVAGTPLLRIDLIDAKSNVTSNQRRSLPAMSSAEMKPRDNTHALPYSSISKRSTLDWLFPPEYKVSSGTFSDIKTLGTIYQEDYVSRNSAGNTPETNGSSGYEVTQFANGTAIPNGSYKILLRVLKITGDAQKEEDYEVWTSPQLDIKRS